MAEYKTQSYTLQSKFKRITDIKIVYSSGCPILFILKVTQGYQPILIKQQ